MIQLQVQIEDYLIHLSDSMGDSKADLLKYIEFFYGKGEQEYEDAEFLVDSEEALDMWFELWNANPDEISGANWKLREWKIGQHMGEFEEFNDLLSLDAEDFVNTHFQVRAGKRVMWELDRVLGEMSVRELWELHREYPMARIEYFG